MQSDGLLRLGTCSWTAAGWAGKFYTKTARQEDFIGEYAEHYDTVEIDSSFYGIPRTSTLARWRELTPPGFHFAAKAPRTITHDRFLEDCGDELQRFLDAINTLGDRLGPLLFQFPYYAKRTGVTAGDFLARLEPFLELLPDRGFSFALEVRNKTWIAPPLLALLQAKGVALALIDHPWMAPPSQLFARKSILTGPFLYIRWLGDRHGIEKITKVWDKTVVDREKDLDAWIPHIKKVLDQKIRVHGYVNNHYSGYAPENVAFLKSKLGGP